MRKPDFSKCENKGADQLCGNSTADQHLCFCYIDSTIPLLPKSEISSLLPSSVDVLYCLCRTWSETTKTDFLVMCLIYSTTASLYEPRYEKTGLRGFRPGPTQTGLYNHRR